MLRSSVDTGHPELQSDEEGGSARADGDGSPQGLVHYKSIGNESGGASDKGNAE